jgi:transcriptional regulator with XRE-family HTH domain
VSPAVQPRSPAHAAFGQAIRELREERGISQEAFALRCSIDRSHYGGMERGERNPSLTSVFKIADSLGVCPSEIHARAERLQDHTGQIESHGLPRAASQPSPPLVAYVTITEKGRTD